MLTLDLSEDEAESESVAFHVARTASSASRTCSWLEAFPRIFLHFYIICASTLCFICASQNVTVPAASRWPWPATCSVACSCWSNALLPLLSAAGYSAQL